MTHLRNAKVYVLEMCPKMIFKINRHFKILLECARGA